MVRPFDPEELNDRIGDFLSTWYHIIVLFGVVLFMFWTRFRPYDNFIREDGIFLGGIDSYYHWRTTLYTIEHWPSTMPFDIWTAYPEGRYVGQFGTAFDQLVATVALIVGLGEPSTTQIHYVVLVMTPLLGALVAVPVYMIGRRLGGRVGGLAGVVLLALFPGSFFTRTTAGQHQHHVVEVLFIAFALLGFMVALRVAEREKPVFEQVIDRDVRGLRTTIAYSTLAGIALGVYMWMWPPGVLLVGILGVFFVVYLSAQHATGRSPEHLAFVGVISMTVASLLILGQIEELSTSPTSFGYIAPVLAGSVALGCGFMGFLSRTWERRGMNRVVYPGAIALSIVIGLGILWLLLPGVVERMVGDFLQRLTPLRSGTGSLTIQEARPPDDFSRHVFREFGLAFYTAIIGLIGLIIAPLLGRQWRAEYALIVIVALFIISMNTAQVRFAYYLAPVVAILNAYAIGLVVEWADLSREIEELKSIEGYQIMVIATVVMILIVPLMPPVASATVIDVGDGQFPQEATFTWDESLEYLDESTPIVGEWGNADNALDIYGTYERPPGGDYEYPPGAYGIMTWWDYGHLLTTKAERIPHSNPFQQNARSSAAFLLADTEERASLILEALPTGATVQEMSNDSLQNAVDQRTEQEANEEFRYVMIDDAMVSSKFGAITAWGGESRGDYTELGTIQLGEDEEADLLQMNERYHDTMAAKLYYRDAAGLEQYRLVHESSHQTIIASIARQDQNGQWQTIALNQEINFRVYQQVQGQPQFQLYDIQQVASVKTFERVEGATITGETDAAPGSIVRATVPMNATTSERGFFYSQEATVQEDGTFELTVPYSTTEELGVGDGVTDSTVIADGNYTIRVFDEENSRIEEGHVDVPEPAIYDGETIEVELEEYEPPEEENGEGTNGEDTEELPDESGDENDTNQSETDE